MTIIATQVIVQAQRISRSATFTVQTTIEKRFLCLVPFAKKNGQPAGIEVIYSRHLEVEQHMIFKTKGNQEDEPDYLWVVTQYNPEAYFIEYTVSTANRVWFITVKCEDRKTETQVAVTYSYTGLNASGNQRNVEMLDRMFAHNLKDWERAINYYLRTGTILE